MNEARAYIVAPALALGSVAKLSMKILIGLRI